MSHKFKIEGIYDQRTLKLLKSKGLRDFGFNFSPKSFNFIQEHVFLTDLVPILDPKDKMHLHFSRSNDPMIKKVLEDLQKIGIKKENIFIDCDEWGEEILILETNFYLNYQTDLNFALCKNPYFSGVIFDFAFFEDLHKKGVINNFISNFYTHYKKDLTNDKKIIMRIDWTDDVFPSLFDYFDFDLMSFPINSKIEICYRNVDLKKLTTEMDLIEKNKNLTDNF